ncbi:MAG TPA: DUF4339 domain-containing protein [Candidatus Sulfotelmatobacter sp.]|nr:DUF4339 domain-containing protein [Candidatus Sulfotelmatobacter sp.]
MNWYYALDNEQKGPVDRSQLEQLLQQGIISGDTLVWQEGMADWLPYSAVAAPAVAAPPVSVSPSGLACSECGQSFAPEQVVRLGTGYVCAGCKPIALQKLREGVAKNSGAEQIRKDHIKHEASIKSVGVLYFLGATILLLASVGMFVPSGKAEAPWMGVLFLGLSAVQIWAGLGLRRLQPWARIPSGILSGVGLLGFPLGTLINGYILYLLFSKKGATVFSEGYKQVIAETPHIKYRTSIVIWILLGLVLLLISLGVFFALFASHR